MAQEEEFPTNWTYCEDCKNYYPTRAIREDGECYMCMRKNLTTYIFTKHDIVKLVSEGAKVELDTQNTFTTRKPELAVRPS